MLWQEIDLEDCAWTISRDRTKNGKTHQVDLSPAAANLIPREKISAHRFVFSTTGYSAPSGFSKTKAKLDKRMAAILGESFQPWRTMTCDGQRRLGWPPLVFSRALSNAF